MNNRVPDEILRLVLLYATPTSSALATAIAYGRVSLVNRRFARVIHSLRLRRILLLGLQSLTRCRRILGDPMLCESLNKHCRVVVALNPRMARCGASSTGAVAYEPVPRLLSEVESVNGDLRSYYDLLRQLLQVAAHITTFHINSPPPAFDWDFLSTTCGQLRQLQISNILGHETSLHDLANFLAQSPDAFPVLRRLDSEVVYADRDDWDAMSKRIGPRLTTLTLRDCTTRSPVLPQGAADEDLLQDPAFQGAQQQSGVIACFAKHARRLERVTIGYNMPLFRGTLSTDSCIATVIRDGLPAWRNTLRELTLDGIGQLDGTFWDALSTMRPPHLQVLILGKRTSVPENALSKTLQALSSLPRLTRVVVTDGARKGLWSSSIVERLVASCPHLKYLEIRDTSRTQLIRALSLEKWKVVRGAMESGIDVNETVKAEVEWLSGDIFRWRCAM